MVYIGTLTPDTADEATTLIPSLASKMDSDTLQPILDELTKMRTWEKFAETGNV
jgi:DNA-directed RNA polymerase II subunit RPB4